MEIMKDLDKKDELNERKTLKIEEASLRFDRCIDELV